MPKSVMNVHFIRNGHRIIFDVRLKGDDIVDQLSFVVLVSLKFDGDITSDGTTYLSGDKKRFGSVTVKFRDDKSWDDAKSHCEGHLDSEGCVNASYLGALDYADPKRRLSIDLLRRVKGQQNSN